MKSKETYIAFLRGINVGGHHKVPMADLRKEMEKLGFGNIETILNSGNVIFDTDQDQLEEKITDCLGKAFGFPIPTVIIEFGTISELLNNNPFKDLNITKDIRLYVSFLYKDHEAKLKLPWRSLDDSFEIIEKRDNTIFSVLDLSVSKTPKAMEALEKYYGRDMTTRNWKTIERIGKRLI